jgi:hypothetical protein
MGRPLRCSEAVTCSVELRANARTTVRIGRFVS